MFFYFTVKTKKKDCAKIFYSENLLFVETYFNLILKLSK